MSTNLNPPEDIDFSSNTSSVDVLILMDCTGSMGAWIDAAKRTALATASQLRKDMPKATFRLGFVGYRDHCDAKRFEDIPMTEDVAAVERALGPITASGGGDAPEDVAGGLDKALSVPWKADATKIVLMVADAPAHGKEYHADGMRDTYPEGDPTGLKPVNQIEEMARRGFDFYFIKCNTSTDDMLKRFSTAFETGKASDNQVFCVLDLTPQGSTPASAPGASITTRDVAPTGAMPRALPSPASLGGPPMAMSVPSSSMAAERSFAAPSRVMASAAAPSARDDDFMRALTTSVKSSMASRSRAT